MKLKRLFSLLTGLLLFTGFSLSAQTTASPDTVCIGAQGVIYFVINTPGSSYQWTVTGTGHTINGNGNNQITVDWAYTVGVDTLTVIETNQFGCVGDPVVLPVIRIPEPDVDAGPDVLICEGDIYTINAASAINYSYIDWTTSGSGTFLNNGTITPTYIPSAGDIAAGTVTLTLIGYGNTPCANDTDQMVMNITLLPIADAGPDGLICEGSTFSVTGATAQNYNVLQWTTSGSGTILGGSTLTPTYIPSAADVAAGIVNLTLIAYGITPCGNDTDQIVLDITPAAIADAGQDGLICENDIFIPINANAANYTSIDWTTSGTGTFANNGTLTPTYTPSAADIAAGGVTLFITSYGIQPCADDIDSLYLTIIPAVIADAGPDGLICEATTFSVAGATASNYASIAWSSTGTGTILNNGTLTPTYIPTAADVAAGSVFLIMNVSGITPCDPVIDTVLLTITPLPVANAGPDSIICEGNDFTVVNAYANNYSSIDWTTTGTGAFMNNGTLTPTYVPSIADIANGGVHLIFTAYGLNPCGDDIDTMYLEITPLPLAVAGVNDTICEGDVFAVTQSSAINYTALQWTTSGTGTFNNSTVLNPVYTPSAADIAAGSVELVLNAMGISPCGNDSDTITLTITPFPIITAVGNDTICEGSDYNITSAMASNYGSVNWSTTGSGTFINNGTLTPTYTPSGADIAAGNVQLIVSAFGLTPCGNASDTINLTIIPAPLVDAGPNDTICEGDLFTVTAATATNYNSSTIVWTTSGTGTFNNANILHPVYTPSQADINSGSVTLTITIDGNYPCGSVSDDMILIIHPKPVTSPIYHY
ncbi:MAG: hypothetical protein RQ866_01045 [Bacteroidales bacterium]|nr:hypothetical protein [Bacteroidales bacterium]